MLHDLVLLGVCVLFSVLLLVIIGQKIGIASPIFLVLSGLLVSLITGVPTIEIEPDLVFLIFLPPILFEAAWFTSWQDFHRWRKPILSMAFGLVFITSIVVGYLSTWLIPGFTLALGFLLGGVNSPPDAVAATSVLKNIKVPRKINALLEGESLINDASSLIVFKFALVASITGEFIWSEAVKDFFIMAIGGTIVGVVVGYFFSLVLKYLPTNSSIDTVMTLLIPYVMYIVAEHFEFSGVLAVVSGGLLMSYYSHWFLSHISRIQSESVWKVLIFMMNTIIFVLIGLELPIVVKGLSQYTITEGIYYSIIIGGAIVGTRLIYCYSLTYIPYFIKRSRGEHVASPDWREPFIISFAAMRGVVSLAAALAIPVFMPNGEAFPHRNIILLVTFVIILITLVGQGLLLKPILKILNVKSDYEHERSREWQDLHLQRRLKQLSLEYITTKYSEDIERNSFVNHQKVKIGK